MLSLLLFPASFTFGQAVDINRQAAVLSYQGATALGWNLTVNERSVALNLRPHDTLFNAAKTMCDSQPAPGYDFTVHEDAVARDNCVQNAVALIAQMLNVTLDKQSLCLGPTLVNTTGTGTLGHFDYTSTSGSSKIHVGIDLPVTLDNCALDLSTEAD
jgi:hypothetical protein